jgi:hypothetical protein
MNHQDAGCGPICDVSTVVPELARYVVRGRRVTAQTARVHAASGYVVCVVPELKGGGCGMSVSVCVCIGMCEPLSFGVCVCVCVY